MKAKPKIHDKTSDMFRSELKSILDLRHELCQLSKEIDWEYLDEELGKLFPSEKGCPATPTRLIVGLFYLKAMYKVSDEDIPRRWAENPYWQYLHKFMPGFAKVYGSLLQVNLDLRFFSISLP